MWLSFGNMHRKNGCCSLGWLLKNFFSGPVSYRPSRMVYPRSALKQWIEFGRDCFRSIFDQKLQINKIEGISNQVLKTILLNFTDRFNGFLHCFLCDVFIQPVLPRNTSRRVTFKMDVLSLDLSRWVSFMTKTDCKGPGLERIQLENESNRKPMRSQILPARSCTYTTYTFELEKFQLWLPRFIRRPDGSKILAYLVAISGCGRIGQRTTMMSCFSVFFPVEAW